MESYITDSLVSGVFTQCSGFETHPCCRRNSLFIPYAFGAACFSVKRPEFVCSFVDGLGCFQLRAIMNKAAMNNLVKYLFFIIIKAKNVMHLKPQ